MTVKHGCVLALALSLFVPSLSGAANPPRTYRAFETVPALARTMLERYPDHTKAVSDPFDDEERKSLILVHKAAITHLKHTSCSLFVRCGGYADVTFEARAYSSPLRRKPAHRFRFDLPQVEKQAAIARAVDLIQPANIEAFAKTLSTKFKTRDARTADGKKAAEFLQTTWKAMAERAGRTEIKVELLAADPDYEQPNVRVTIPGTDLRAPSVILGGHIDSTSFWGAAPGADDNASGVAALTEIFRVILAAEFRPKATIQLFGYAAEELGLIGSHHAAESYRTQNVPVRGVLQLDMVAFPGKSRAMTFVVDNVDAALTEWTKQLYQTYVGGPVKQTACGYGCSDHASWDRFGFSAVFPFETPADEMNSKIHSSRDVWDERLDASHAALFARLGYAFAATLADSEQR